MRDHSLPLTGAAGDDHALELFQRVDRALGPHRPVASNVHGVRRPGNVERDVEGLTVGVVLLGVDDGDRVVAADGAQARHDLGAHRAARRREHDQRSGGLGRRLVAQRQALAVVFEGGAGAEPQVEHADLAVERKHERAERRNDQPQRDKGCEPERLTQARPRARDDRQGNDAEKGVSDQGEPGRQSRPRHETAARRGRCPGGKLDRQRQREGGEQARGRPAGARQPGDQRAADPQLGQRHQPRKQGLGGRQPIALKRLPEPIDTDQLARPCDQEHATEQHREWQIDRRHESPMLARAPDGTVGSRRSVAARGGLRPLRGQTPVASRGVPNPCRARNAARGGV
jgi:hypothetical protein